MKKLTLSILTLAASVVLASGSRTVWKHPGNIRIVSGKHPTAVTVKFPALPQMEKMRAVLSFDSWLEMEKCAGWNHYVQLRLNDVRLRENISSGEKRLLRRGSEMQTSIGNEPWWKGDMLMTFFGPGPAGKFDGRVKNAKKERYRFALDITDTVNFIEIGADKRIESANENTLVLTNNYLLQYIKRNGVSPQIDMFIGGLQIDLVPESVVKSERPAQELFAYPATPGKTVAQIALPEGKAEVTDGGDMLLKVGKETFALQSDFSYPATPEMKYNTLSAGKYSGVKSWKPVISAKDGVVTVKAVSAQYTLTRKISRWQKGLRIEDTLQNTSKSDIAVAIRYNLIADELLGSKKYFLAGNTDVDIREGIGANPTVLAIKGNASAGMMAYDAVFRNQTQARHVGNAVNFTNTHLGIPAGKSRTIVRLVHLMDSPDEFVYLNLLRRELNRNNVTIPGPFKFGHRAWKEWPKTMRNSIVNGVPWIEYMNGSGKSREEIKKMAEEELAAIHAKDPGMKLLATLEHNLVAVDTSKIPGGEILPGKPGDSRHYGIKLNAAQSKLLESNPNADSMIRDKNGRIVVENYFSKPPFVDFFVYAEVGNYRYKHMIQLIDYLMDECGYNGIYIDQFAAGAAAWNRVDRARFDKWDGFSVNMSADGKIKDKLYDYTVTASSARVNITQHVLDKGGIFIANTQPCTEEETLVPGVRFTEMENNNVTDTLLGRDEPSDFLYQALGQLSSTPSTLGIRPHMHLADRKQWGKILNRSIIIALRHGLVYYNYNVGVDERYGGYGILDKMFPITPVELGKGFIIGKERILTAVSRQFVLDIAPQGVYQYDSNGIPKTADYSITPDGKGKFIINVKLDDWNETCAIIL
ncbi:MAG: hypothetical protein J6S43_02300 [Lentisphaeria bacterium]|nr:hypothetical protein [Lentisphaeria bacterium]